MADWTDHADEIIGVFQGAALTNARYKAVPKPPADFDGRHCVECGDKIEAPRLKHGLFMCFGCADYMERKAKGAGR